MLFLFRLKSRNICRNLRRGGCRVAPGKPQSLVFAALRLVHPTEPKSSDPVFKPSTPSLRTAQTILPRRFSGRNKPGPARLNRRAYGYVRRRRGRYRDRCEVPGHLVTERELHQCARSVFCRDFVAVVKGEHQLSRGGGCGRRDCIGLLGEKGAASNITNTDSADVRQRIFMGSLLDRAVILRRGKGKSREWREVYTSLPLAHNGPT